MKNLRDTYQEHRTNILLPLAGELLRLLKEYYSSSPRIDRITVRAKSVERFLAKATLQVNSTQKYCDPINQIQDQIGARIVTYYSSDVERMSGEVERYFRPIEAKLVVPDTESEFGYFGKHFILLLPSDIFDDQLTEDRAPQFFELQVKTLFQHAWSEANHDLGYKPTTELSSDQKRKIAFTSAQAWGADLIFEELHRQISGIPSELDSRIRE